MYYIWPYHYSIPLIKKKLLNYDSLVVIVYLCNSFRPYKFLSQYHLLHI